MKITLTIKVLKIKKELEKIIGMIKSENMNKKEYFVELFWSVL